MAVLVYRKGESHEIRGIKCEMARIEVRSLQNHLNAGWVTDINDLVSKPIVEPVEVEDDGSDTED